MSLLQRVDYLEERVRHLEEMLLGKQSRRRRRQSPTPPHRDRAPVGAVVPQKRQRHQSPSPSSSRVEKRPEQHSVYVSGAGMDKMTEDALRNIFSHYGQLSKVWRIWNTFDKGRMGRVTYHSEQDAKKAMSDASIIHMEYKLTVHEQ